MWHTSPPPPETRTSLPPPRGSWIPHAGTSNNLDTPTATTGELVVASGTEDGLGGDFGGPPGGVGARCTALLSSRAGFGRVKRRQFSVVAGPARAPLRLWLAQRSEIFNALAAAEAALDAERRSFVASVARDRAEAALGAACRAADADFAGESRASSSDEDAFTGRRSLILSGPVCGAAYYAASAYDATPVGGRTGAHDDWSSAVSCAGARPSRIRPSSNPAGA